MGLLSVGEPLSWDETRDLSVYIRHHGIQQFIYLFRKTEQHQSDVLKFGDEIEYMIVRFDDESGTVRVSNRATELLEILQHPENNAQEVATLWRPEFGAYMIEGTPGHPYSINLSPSDKLLVGNLEPSNQNGSNQNLIQSNLITNNSSKIFSFLKVIETNMQLRRRQVRDLLEKNESVLSISSFPLLGTYDFCSPSSYADPITGYSRSLFFSDQAIFMGHPRFRTLANNIRERRKRNQEIYLPIFQDVNTPKPFIENFAESINVNPQNVNLFQYRLFVDEAKKRQNEYGRENQVYMDSMGFGMGCCCLQVTFQASDLQESCLLYDQLIPLCPIMMALSAASPIFRGYLTDVDCRWSVISSSVDDRTVSEITGLDPLTKEKTKKIYKSRFDSVDLYLSESNVKYNDIKIIYDEDFYKILTENRVPKLISKHIAHLFIRDPLVVFKEKLETNDQTDSDHFENIQSTNWQTMRFKPPPSSSPEIGWRIEFRPMEVQLTDTENAAYIVFIVLITRLILSMDLNLLIPISKVDENMKLAQKRDAVNSERFWFRKKICSTKKLYNCLEQCPQNFSNAPPQTSPPVTPQSSSTLDSQENDHTNDNHSLCSSEYGLLTIDEIINGSKEKSDDDFPGLIPLINFYLESIEIDAEIRCNLNKYLRIISKRASGEMPTTAQLIRKFIHNHDKYQADSKVTNRIAYDLLKLFDRIDIDSISFEDLYAKVLKK
ncbi:Glutamate--cysteine ligase catalytic subunit [Sarcoptes scabiei]|uniref:Glutamate--cysteine ligase n=1 Tax=Sarcoptes scabiei TaxID=52283 RepID=A0A834R8B5_SARSC|nr:Glutamate--cysteine ligase catalytic subunit [Sarcoptes scabiei]UXI22165.1 hypothetical protein NH340_JMT08108 [Sarcoptes scabiei]